jgi:hypothetical protein
MFSLSQVFEADEVPAEKQFLYWQALKTYGIGAVEAGVWACIRELKAFPKPVEIIQRMFTEGQELPPPVRKALPEPMDPIIARESMGITYALLDGTMTMEQAVKKCEELNRKFPKSIWRKMANDLRRSIAQRSAHRTGSGMTRLTPVTSTMTVDEQKAVLATLFPQS